MDATTFPISFTYHLVFCIVACLFFILQFYRQRRPHQLVLAFAIAGSMLIYLDTSNKSLFHAVGLYELVLLLGAIVLSFLFHGRKKEVPAAPTEDTEKNEQESETQL